MYRADAKHGVDLGEFLQHLVAVALRHASGNYKTVQGMVFLEPCGIKYIVYRFALCSLYEGAGVYHYYVRLGLVGGYLVAGESQLVEHHLCVKLIFGASE